MCVTPVNKMGNHAQRKTLCKCQLKYLPFKKYTQFKDPVIYFSFIRMESEPHSEDEQ